LLAAISSFLLVLADSPKIIGPLLFIFMTTFVVPILMLSPSVVLLEVVDICPLSDWSAFAAEWSGNLAGPVPGERIEGHSIGIVHEVSTCQKQMIGVPPSGVLWYPKWIWWHTPHLIWEYGGGGMYA
jgi:hypothetical protein